MACKETETVCILFQKHLSQISVSKTNLTLVCYRTRNTECLKALTDSCGSVSSLSAALLDRDGSAYCISPARILKADRLDLLNLSINVKACIFCNLFSFLDRSNAIAV